MEEPLQPKTGTVIPRLTIPLYQTCGTAYCTHVAIFDPNLSHFRHSTVMVQTSNEKASHNEIYLILPEAKPGYYSKEQRMLNRFLVKHHFKICKTIICQQTTETYPKTLLRKKIIFYDCNLNFLKMILRM